MNKTINFIEIAQINEQRLGRKLNLYLIPRPNYVDFLKNDLSIINE